MTATDELRRMLDERGAKYSYEYVTEGTLFVVTRDVRTYYILAREKGFEIWSDWLTPEQAISATLGAGTCQLKPWEMERDTGFYDCMECACGYVADVADWAEWRYCPNCGRNMVAS